MVTVKVDQSKEFNRALKKASKELDNLTIPLNIIAREWFKTNKSIFTLQGYGKYAPYKRKSYEDKKIRSFGKISILKVSGTLERSITNPSDKFSVNEIVNKKTLIVGSKVLSKRGKPYAIYLQNGTKFMAAARPPILFGIEQVAPRTLNKRFENWTELLENFTLNKSKQFGKIKK